MSDWKEFLKDWGISDDLGLRYKLAKAIEDKVCTLLEEERKKWEREWKEKVKKALNSKTYPDKVKSQCADELEGLIWFKYADGTQCLRSGFVIEQIDNLIKKWRNNANNKNNED